MLGFNAASCTECESPGGQDGNEPSRPSLVMGEQIVSPSRLQLSPRRIPETIISLLLSLRRKPSGRALQMNRQGFVRAHNKSD